ncbi:putative leucine-rich repeat-containing protein DDB_G0290503 [Narcine bancroftii]|uniref:putative leucine-rich repeat-containing protein DDB_G0290503 n=1 Tax=Narcine bancroftii TaxID=1343680 RepID=UPI0038315991
MVIMVVVVGWSGEGKDPISICATDAETLNKYQTTGGSRQVGQHLRRIKKLTTFQVPSLVDLMNGFDNYVGQSQLRHFLQRKTLRLFLRLLSEKLSWFERQELSPEFHSFSSPVFCKFALTRLPPPVYLHIPLSSKTPVLNTMLGDIHHHSLASSNYKHLSRLCNTVFQHMADESSPSKYTDLKNSLTHLRSQIQNGDILFRKELMQQKWTAVLDSARNKNTQTPSIGQCVQEAMILAKLASEYAYGYPKLSEALKEGRLIPLLEANTCALANLMQTLRTGNVEKVRTFLQLPEMQRELDVLLDPAGGHLASCDLSSPMAEKQEIRQCKDALVMVKELVSDVTVPVDIITHDQLEPESWDAANLNLLPVPKCMNCKNSDAASCILSKAPCSVKGEPGRIATDKTIANLEAEVGKLRAEKAVIDQCLQRANGQLLEAAEEKSRLEDKLNATGREVNYMAQKLESLTKGKIQEEESMKNNLRKENEVLEKRNKELLNEIVKLKSSLQETEAEFEGKSGEFLQRMSQLEEDKKEIENRFTCMQQENVNKLIKCHQSIEKLSSHNEELKGRLSELQSTEKSLNNMVIVLKEKVEKLMKENEHLLHKINQVDKEKASQIHEAMHRLTGENENLLDKVRELENELDNCFTANNTAQEKINQLENENTELMNLKKELNKGLKAQGDAERNNKQDNLKGNMQQSDDLSQEATWCEDDKKVMLTTKAMFEVKQSKNVIEQNVQLKDILTEISTVKITGRSNDGNSLASKDKSEYENLFNEETQMIIEACLEEPEMEGISSLEKSGYHTIKRKSPDAEKSETAFKAQLASVEGKNSLGKLLERAEVELKSKQEGLDKTKAENVPEQSIGQRGELSPENVITFQQQFLSLNSQLKVQVTSETRLQELQCKLELLQNQLDMKSKAEMDLRMENYCMKGQLDALEQQIKNTENLRTKYSEMKSERDIRTTIYST